MNVNVMLFAAAKELAGTSTSELSLPDSAVVADLRQALIAAHPALQPLAPSLLIAVNNQYAVNSDPLSPTDSIACFPPVSGG